MGVFEVWWALLVVERKEGELEDESFLFLLAGVVDICLSLWPRGNSELKLFLKVERGAFFCVFLKSCQPQISEFQNQTHQQLKCSKSSRVHF